MLVQRKGIMVGYRHIILALVLIQTIGWSQDLTTAWRNYLSMNTRLGAALESQRNWTAHQDRLSEEIRNLQKSQSWYNGWIIEARIANRSSLQVELADSLQQIQDKIAQLDQRRDEALLALKTAYQQLLLEPAADTRLSPIQIEQAIAIGRQVIGQADASIDLPDYTSILNSPFENNTVRQLVLQDLRTVLMVKLTTLDSLIIEKESEVALLQRLNEFHRDLSYQMRSNLDIESSGYPSSAENGTIPPNDEFGRTVVIDAGWYGATGEEGSLPDKAASSLSQSAVVSGESDVDMDARSIALNSEPIHTVIQRLKNKRQQYQDLLKQIETELPD